jgi:A/G-specific adenine glycosylase
MELQQNFLSISPCFDSEHLQDGQLAPEGIELFRKLIYDYYYVHGRRFAWRETTQPYHIVVSEVMLQQTQTDRVKEKFEQFIAALPTFQALAQAPVRDVITLWQGLGYNRRALALHKIAQKVMNEHNGLLPQLPEILTTFPGLGPNTAGSVCAFAFNLPTIFIETNIRAVYIHCFFQQKTDIKDKELIPLINQTLDRNNPRSWYYALMDYGVMLKKKFKNPSRKSAHYSVQSKFEGSERQIRGMILRALSINLVLSFDELCLQIPREPERIRRNLDALCMEGFIKVNTDCYLLL